MMIFLGPTLGASCSSSYLKKHDASLGLSEVGCNPPVSIEEFEMLKMYKAVTALFVIVVMLDG